MRSVLIHQVVGGHTTFGLAGAGTVDVVGVAGGLATLHDAGKVVFTVVVVGGYDTIGGFGFEVTGIVVGVSGTTLAL